MPDYGRGAVQRREAKYESFKAGLRHTLVVAASSAAADRSFWAAGSLSSSWRKP